MNNCGSCIKSLDEQPYRLSYSDNAFIEDLEYWCAHSPNGFGEMIVCLILFSKILIGTVPTHSAIKGYLPINVHNYKYDLHCKYITNIYDNMCNFEMKDSCKILYDKLHYVLKKIINSNKSKFRYSYGSHHTTLYSFF